MVVPNIGAFIAWGLITALFIPTGWAPNETYVKLVGPMILNLLPILIGYTGGSVIYGHRGGVIGAVTTMGVVVGSSIPQFLGGMIMGPSAAWVLKKVDGVLQPRVPVGFELLVNNFALGILGLVITMVAQTVIGPVVEAVSNFFGSVVSSLVSAGLLPLADLIVEPAKVLFLNNALNLGVLAPLGAAAAGAPGWEPDRSVEFIVGVNAGSAHDRTARWRPLCAQRGEIPDQQWLDCRCGGRVCLS